MVGGVATDEGDDETVRVSGGEEVEERGGEGGGDGEGEEGGDGGSERLARTSSGASMPGTLRKGVRRMLAAARRAGRRWSEESVTDAEATCGASVMTFLSVLTAMIIAFRSSALNS